MSGRAEQAALPWPTDRSAGPLPRSAAPEILVAVLRSDGDSQLEETETQGLTAVLAVGIAAQNAGRFVMRTRAPGTSDRVYGWRLRGDGLQPLSGSEVFDAYRTDAEAAGIVVPESNVDYCEPPDLGEAGQPGGGHTH